MKMIYNLPTKIIVQRDAVKERGELFSCYGKKAFIITGKSSAKKCGALKDVCDTLVLHGISYVLFDEIENNPSIETIEKAMILGRKEKVDFCIGIGGGSPLDASKAIAVLIANQEMKVIDLFQNTFSNACPIIAIPTTAGTGSEATPYSVLLRKDLETKVSFGNSYTFPAVALVDSKYTTTMDRNSTINTAIDAFTHLLEGYLANRSMPISDAFALDGIKIWGSVLPHLRKFELSSEDREDLMYASVLGGMVIAHTGVTIAHGMGYCFTYFHNIPHGKANGLLMREYLHYNYSVRKEKIDKVLELLECKSIDEFGDILEELLGKAPQLSIEDIDRYTELTLLQKGSITNTPNPIDEEKIRNLWGKYSKK